MWANTTLSSWSPATVTAPRSNRRPFTVSAKPPRRQKNIKYDYDEDEIETDQELERLKQQQIGEPDTYVSNSDEISGSVVLLALQKASAQKTSKKIKKKKVENMKARDEDNRRKQGDAIVDYGEVKALCIKSDWKDRLNELEMQLHQLIHHT